MDMDRDWAYSLLTTEVRLRGRLSSEVKAALGQRSAFRLETKIQLSLGLNSCVEQMSNYNPYSLIHPSNILLR